MATKPKSGPQIPDDLRRQYEQIVLRAGAAGRPLNPVPVLELAAHRRQGSRAFVGPPNSSQPPQVRLSLDTLATPAPERAWGIAHELGHVLRHQEGTRISYTRTALAMTGLLGAAVLAATLTVAYRGPSSAQSSSWPLLAAALVALVVLWVMLTLPIRREETGADTTAATVFGEVLTDAGVRRLRRAEGGHLVRYLPALLRTHPEPAARRRAGLDTPRPQRVKQQLADLVCW